MILRASNVDNIDDFIDCAIFNVDYIVLDINTLLKKGRQFGVCISSVPLLKNELVLSINSVTEEEIDSALAMCNINILEFNNKISASLIAKYKKNYTICKYIENVEDAKKYADQVDSFIIPYEKLQALLQCKEISNHQLIVKATKKEHIEDIKDISSRKLIVDIKYDDNHMSHFIKNKKLTIKKELLNKQI